MNGNQGGGGAFGPPGGGGAFGPPGGGGGGGAFGPPGGGGGFGSPPGGAPPGGGGAFGPPGGGGGAFGPPGGGAPPSGGAFGPPGGTNLGGGGGASGPPGGGGEGPLSHIPFTPQEEASIGGAGKFMFFAGIVSILNALVTLVKSGVQLWAAPELNGGVIAGAVCVNVVSMALAAVFGVWLFAGSKALRKVIETNQDDQIHLVQAIQKLRQVFALKAVLLILLLVACGVAIVAGGAMAFSAMR